MKRIGIIALLLIGAILLSGCTTSDKLNQQKAYEEKMGVSNIQVGATHNFEQKFTEENQRRLVTANPPVRLDKSLERENLSRRYGFLNDEDKIFYVYLVSYGKVMAYYVAKGKISSVNSRLTQEEQVIVDQDCLTRVYHESEGNCYKTVGSPQLDGSYGTNGDGIFFFTTEGAYVEWNGEYIVSDFPLAMETPPTLIKNVE